MTLAHFKKLPVQEKLSSLRRLFKGEEKPTTEFEEIMEQAGINPDIESIFGVGFNNKK